MGKWQDDDSHREERAHKRQSYQKTMRTVALVFRQGLSGDVKG